MSLDAEPLEMIFVVTLYNFHCAAEIASRYYEDPLLWQETHRVFDCRKLDFLRWERVRKVQITASHERTSRLSKGAL